MNRFAALIDRLAFEHGRNAKLRQMTEYFRTTPDPERGYALAALTGALSFKHAKPGLIRELIAQRTDPVLFALSYDYVGDLSETVALLWPSGGHDAGAPSPHVGEGWGGGSELEEVEAPQSTPHQASRPAAAQPPSPARGEGQAVPGGEAPSPLVGENHAAHGDHPHPGARTRADPPHKGEGNGPTLSEVIEKLATLGKTELPGQLARWLDQLDETGRWALLKLVTGALRIGVSARLGKSAVAALASGEQPITADEIELVWPALAPPYLDLFAWVEGRSERPQASDPAPFRPVMLSHAIEETELAALDPADFMAEWKWDGIRVQAVAGVRDGGTPVCRLYTRTGEDISSSFPDLVAALDFAGALDGELLILRETRVQSFNILQQRLNRKSVTPRLLTEFPAHLRAYDILVDGERDLRELAFAERRARLENFLARNGNERIDISPLVRFSTWQELTAARANPAAHGAGVDAEAVEGVMLKRRDAPYLPGRPKGPWWKWKRDPFTVDAVLMYAQRGHGKRSSYYSDYTFGLWTNGANGDELVPVGKAYFGFTDEELIQIDRFVRQNTINRFGPVREVEHSARHGLVAELAFEGLQRSTRHRSGVAMRFPRISRLRWDKPPGEADRLEMLERLLPGE